MHEIVTVVDLQLLLIEIGVSIWRLDRTLAYRVQVISINNAMSRIAA
jgi:hypothetical protein